MARRAAVLGALSLLQRWTVEGGVVDVGVGVRAKSLGGCGGGSAIHSEFLSHLGLTVLLHRSPAPAPPPRAPRG